MRVYCIIEDFDKRNSIYRAYWCPADSSRAPAGRPRSSAPRGGGVQGPGSPAGRVWSAGRRGGGGSGSSAPPASRGDWALKRRSRETWRPARLSLVLMGRGQSSRGRGGGGGSGENSGLALATCHLLCGAGPSLRCMSDTTRCL